MDNPVKHLLEFGPFRIDPEQRLLLRDEQPIPISPKAFDLLMVLIQSGGQILLKDDLMKTLWPDTFVEESNLGQHVFQLRKALGERPQDHSYIITVPGRGYRFAQKVRTVAEEEEKEDGEEQIVMATRSLARVVIEEKRETDLRPWVILGAVVVVALAAVAMYWRSAQKPKLAEKDTIVLADFDNKTGDPIFDGTLRQGLSAQLAQSPFLNLLSDRNILHTLSLMGQPKDAQLKPELAREVCQRAQSTAVLDGSITQIGTRYLLTLKAVACSTGELLAATEAEAPDKGHVLDVLGKIASEIRGKLGESLASVEKYDVPPRDVTTPSLEALRAYSLGSRSQSANKASESISLYQQAISLDPNFAMAYTGLGTNYFNLDETTQAQENVRRAYELREHVSEREKLGIELIYYVVAVRNFEAARKSGELAIQIYPRESSTLTNLGTIYGYLGDYDKSLASLQKALELTSGNLQSYTNLLIAYTHVNQFDKAEAVARNASSRNLDSPFAHACLYQVDFLKNDEGAMEKEAAQVVGKPGFEDLILYYESDTAAYHGQFAKARELTRRAADSAIRTGQKETAAEYEAEAAVREALIGNLALASRQANDALALSKGRDVTAISAIALAMAGDSAGTRMGNDLGSRFPEDTVLTYQSLPSIQSAAALRNNDLARAITTLTASTPYELGQTAQEVSFVLYPIYLRGEALLAAKQGTAAAAEFQKILDHPGLVQNEPIGALAYLELGRAYILKGDTANAHAAYQNFFTLWKDADPDVPILKEAKAEYAKLQ
jgi:DNA-binding winged helix-turn-helix (wHTH) protein/tetratricopeptide (TPR) repeat protein